MIADPVRPDSVEADKRSSVGEDELTTLYYKWNGKWISIAMEALLDPEENYDIYSSPTKREQDPLNPLKDAESPL